MTDEPAPPEVSIGAQVAVAAALLVVAGGLAVWFTGGPAEPAGPGGAAVVQVAATGELPGNDELERAEALILSGRETEGLTALLALHEVTAREAVRVGRESLTGLHAGAGKKLDSIPELRDQLKFAKANHVAHEAALAQFEMLEQINKKFYAGKLQLEKRIDRPVVIVHGDRRIRVEPRGSGE